MKSIFDQSLQRNGGWTGKSAIKLRKSEREREASETKAHESRIPTPMRLTVQSFQRKFDTDQCKTKNERLLETLIQQIDNERSMAF
jgi:hypothetical protein